MESLSKAAKSKSLNSKKTYRETEDFLQCVTPTWLWFFIICHWAILMISLCRFLNSLGFLFRSVPFSAKCGQLIHETSCDIFIESLLGRRFNAWISCSWFKYACKQVGFFVCLFSGVRGVFFLNLYVHLVVRRLICSMHLCCV